MLTSPGFFFFKEANLLLYKPTYPGSKQRDIFLSRFTIYLQTGAESEPDEVAFVLDARFNFGESQRKIVTNHKKEGAWGIEEDGDCEFVFNEEENFKIKIIVEDDSFKVKIKG